MRLLAILTDRNHKRVVRHVAHAINGEIDFYNPDELIDIEPHINYDCLIIAASYEDVDGVAVLDHLHDAHPRFNFPPIAAIDNGAVELVSDRVTLISEYHLESALTEWLRPKHTDNLNANSQRPHSILYISDDRLMHAIVKDLYKNDDTTIIHAYDGLSGYQIYKEKSPDLILTDLDIPLLDGFGLLQRIKIQDGDQRTSILVFSSTSDENTIMEAYRLKAKGYLIKPMAPIDLKHKVEKHLHNNRTN